MLPVIAVAVLNSEQTAVSQNNSFLALPVDKLSAGHRRVAHSLTHKSCSAAFSELTGCPSVFRSEIEAQGRNSSVSLADREHLSPKGRGAP